MPSTAIQPLPLPDRRIDAAVHARFREFVLDLNSGPCSAGVPVPHYSKSIDAVIDLITDLLPGWAHVVISSAACDRVWLAPDRDHPEHGKAFLNRWPEDQHWLSSGPGLEASFTTSPRSALALLSIFIEVIDALEEDRTPGKDVPAAVNFFQDAIDARPLPYRQAS